MDIIIEEFNNTKHNYYEYCFLLKELTSINPDKISQQDFMNHMSKIQSNPYHKIFVASINNKIIGSITILIEPKIIHDLSYVSHIEDVVVSTQYRGQGIGLRLMNKAIEVSQEYGCYKIILDCAISRIDFYNKCGFVVYETQMVKRLDK